MIMVNARLSPRSEGRYAKVRGITRLLFERLSALGAQNDNDKGRFARIGVNPDIITAPGSIKFDVMGDTPHNLREDFRSILDRLRGGKSIVLAASTHAGEEALIASAIREAGAFPLIVPRHAERREQVVADLLQAGFTPLLRTAGNIPTDLPDNVCYVADTTGELRDWTALADAVVIGKSFLARGGQNPVEAIAAHKPVIIGPDMTNFADLVTLLKKEDAILSCDAPELSATIRQALDGSAATKARTERAYQALHVHSGATQRSVQLVDSFYKNA